MTRPGVNSPAARLRQARELAGLTLAQASRLLNIDRSLLVQVEDGESKLSNEDLVKWADVYGVGVAWLACEPETSDLPTPLIVAREGSSIENDDLHVLLELVEALRGKGKRIDE